MLTWSLSLHQVCHAAIAQLGSLEKQTRKMGPLHSTLAAMGCTPTSKELVEAAMLDVDNQQQSKEGPISASMMRRKTR